MYRCAPKKNPMYAYRESVPLGVTSLSPARAAACVSALRATWMGTDYDVLTKNCNHFCEALCAALGCEGPPRWLNSFANGANGAVGTVAYARSGVERACAEAVRGVRGVAERLASAATSLFFASTMRSSGAMAGSFRRFVFFFVGGAAAAPNESSARRDAASMTARFSSSEPIGARPG